MSLEEFISTLTKEDLELINREFAKKENKIPIFQFSKIRDIDLRNLLSIKRVIDKSIWNDWFDNSRVLDDKTTLFLDELLQKEENYIKIYKEENLKVKFITPILNRVDFVIGDIRDFYEEKMTYKTDKFIFTGTTDFLVSKGYKASEKPYFFIQEFKKELENSDPEPQLLAELISAVELNSWNSIKGCYIVGAIWNFVILEKLGKDRYQYFISVNFDSTKIEDLKDIYRNLLFVKNEIIEMVKKEELDN